MGYVDTGSGGCSHPNGLASGDRHSLSAVVIAEKCSARRSGLMPLSPKRVTQGRTGMQRERDLVAMKAQDKRLLVLVEEIGEKRPATDDAVEADIADMRQRLHLVP